MTTGTAESTAEATDPREADYDLIVIGAGAAGMATALFAAIEGMKVLVLERTQWVGGTSALSAGALWIPNTHLAAGSGDTPQRAARYLELSTGGRTPARLRERFLSLGPQVVRILEDHTEVRMRAFARHPDYLSELEGSTTHGRALECLPFDGRQLGDAFALVRPPIPEFTVLGGMMVDRIDIGHLLNLTRSAASFAHASRLLLRYLADRLRHPRGTRLVMGNALVGRLLFSLQKRQVPVWTQTTVDRLLEANDRVTGVEVSRAGARQVLHARAGVVLAGGGFNEHPQLRKQLIPAEVRHSPRAGASPALLYEQALALGARLGKVEGSAAFLTPVSARTRADGSTAVFPHFVLDRGKPGTVVVNAQGRRFVNESASYQLFGERMLEQHSGHRPNALAFLIADRRALLKYGLGMVRPGGRGVAAALRSGYLVRAQSVAALAQALDIDATALTDTVERMNRYAKNGLDADFQRGSTAYQTNLGDPAVGPNPNLGAIETPPFYALRLYPGDIGAAVGLVTDADARVLRGDAPIGGLFAVGNDMHSVMGDAYPGPGITLGPAVVFAFAAAQAARRGKA
ncbi:MAG TPA: FAD-dependent oxidoreductase [Burkholderiales bacterium]